MGRRISAGTLVVTLFLSLVAQATDYYVGKKGSDTAPGTRQDKAFLTIARGVKELKPGDTLIVGPGVYREQVFVEKSGTKDKPITLRAQLPGRTELVGSVRLTDWTPVRGRAQVFRASLARPTYMVYEKDTNTEYTEVANVRMVALEAGSFFYDADAKALYAHPSDDLGMGHHVVDACVFDYGIASLTIKGAQKHSPRRVGLVIEGFVVRDYNMHGIYIRNADYCHIRNCIVHHCRRGLFTYNSLRSSITRCEVWSCADRFNREQGNIGMMGYVFECLLEGNVIHTTRQHGIRFYGGHYGNTMRNNLAYGCGIGIHVKGRVYDLAKATRYARYSDGGKANLKPSAPMIFEGNVAHQVTGSAGLLSHYSIARRNTGTKVQSGRATKRELNLEYMPSQEDAARFAAPEWHDLRLQSDSPHRKGGKNKDDLGAFPYKGNVFFVSPEGDDKSDGTSVAKAWKTMRHASTKLKSGQTLYLTPGVYTDSLALKGLRSVTVRAREKGTVTLDLGGKLPLGVGLRECRDVKIQGLRIRGTTGAAIAAWATEKGEISENELFDNAGVGVDLMVATGRWRVARNTIISNGGAGVRSGRSDGLWLVGNIIRDNRTQVEGTVAWCDYNSIGGTTEARMGPHSADLPPGFVDAVKRDLRLTPTSLCRGRGYLGRAMGAGRVAPASREGLSFENVRVVASSSTTADLAWSVKGGLGTMIVAYGTDPSRLESRIVKDTGHWYRRHHLMTLRNLKPGTRYFLRVGSRRVLEGEAAFHSYRYLWPERTPKGEAKYYATLKKEDTLDTRLVSFATRTRDVVAPRVFHVSVKGNDGSDGSKAAPFRSIVRACEIAGPGDRVAVRGGAYYETIRPLRSGLPGHPITFEAARGERVQIDGRRELIPHAVDLVDRHHIVIRGFVFHGQTEFGKHRGHFGHVRVVACSDILIERCLFDGRMNYCNSINIAYSRGVTVYNSIFVSHHAGVMPHDNPGTVTLARNTFLGSTLAKIYGPRNAHLIIKNNLFGEHLFPKKKKQYKVKIPGITKLEMDYNCYYFDPKNDERRMVDFIPGGVDLTTTTAQPERDKAKERIGVRTTLDAWHKRGFGKHSLVVDDLKWAQPAAVKAARSRKRGWPNRFFDYAPLTRADLRLADANPCKGAGEKGVTIGADHAY